MLAQSKYWCRFRRMPFVKQAKIEDFIPDINFDQREDLVKVSMSDQELYVPYLYSTDSKEDWRIDLDDSTLDSEGYWRINLDDPTVSQSMKENFTKSELRMCTRPPAYGVVEARLGSFLYFSHFGYDSPKMLQSEKVITGFEVTQRSKIGSAVSTLVLDKYLCRQIFASD